MKNVEKVSNFLKDAQIFYLLTSVDGQPKGRPFAFHMVEDDRIYFATVTFKNVYKQMQDNPKVEIVATLGQQFLRYDGQAVFHTEGTLLEKVLEIMPEIKDIYKDRPDFELTVFHLENGKVEIRNMVDTVESFDLPA